MSQSKRRKAPAKTIPMAPEMPDELRRLILELCPTPPADLDQVIKALQAHIKTLCQFQFVLEEKAVEAARAKSPKREKPRKDGDRKNLRPGIYARQRDLHDIYAQTRLRHRAWEALELCHTLNCPPPSELCELYRHMDAPGGVYQFEYLEPWERRQALALVAEAVLSGKTVGRTKKKIDEADAKTFDGMDGKKRGKAKVNMLSYTDLAKMAGIQYSTLMSWIYKKVSNEDPNLPKGKRDPIKDERWKRDLADEIERRKARREQTSES